VSDGSKGVPLIAVSVGSEPLQDSKRERFCQGIVAGADELELYYKLWKDEVGVPRSKKATAISQKSKIKHEERVIARLNFLRRQNAAIARVDREEKLKITEEIIQGLRADFRNGDRGKTVSDLMTALARHDAMCGESEKPTLKIELGLGGLLSGIDKVVETRLGLSGGSLSSGKSLEEGKGEKEVEGGEVLE